MSVYRMTLPDVGEGVAEAELVEWFVAVGDEVTTDSVLAEVLTDKATVEVSAPVAGVVAVLHGEPGDVLAVGGDLIEIDQGGDDDASDDGDDDRSEADGDGGDARSDGEADDGQRSEADTAAADERSDDDAADGERSKIDDRGSDAGSDGGDDDGERSDAAAAARDGRSDAGTDHGRPLAAPAVRARARDLGIDLAAVRGSGPEGRIVHADLDRAIVGGRVASRPGTAAVEAGEPTVQPVRGIRRQIAARLTETWQRVPHITYVEAIDATELERTRAALNERAPADSPRLTMLPFLARAIALASAEQPGINAHYDHDAETLTTFAGVHVGIATQTDNGLLVPVVRHVESLGMRDLAAEIARVTAAARDGSASRQELTGSTITITSLGALGGIATTPILNAPEVAIIGVNKLETRSVWRNGAFEPRQVFNLSSSFDHRMVDGWDAATYVQRLKALLETPALLFTDDA